MKFYAHSTDNPDKTDWHTLSDHLIGVGEGACRAADWFGCGEMARAAGLLHDLGKYTARFQARLEGREPKLDHATWGGYIARKHYDKRGLLLAYAIVGHHAGLANGVDGEARTSLKDRLESELAPLLPAWQDEIVLPDLSAVVLPKNFRSKPDRTGFQLSMLVRMLFSALVDADYLDTNAFYRRIGGDPVRPAAAPTLQQLRDKLDSTLSAFSANSDVNRMRADILGHVRAQAGLEAGLFSLTVPTGGGKTLASLAFALDHAIAHGLRRVIYVIPYTSIIEQTAQVFRAAFADLGDAAVLEHHSAFIDDRTRNPEAQDKLRVAMENWDAPVVVTTAVQFFESLFADRPSRCRKLHNIAGSVVILDEAQTLPLHLLQPCVVALDELALNYRTSVVLCTATQPALHAADGFPGGLTGVRELAPDPPALYRKLQRVTARHLGALDDDALASQLSDRDQVLCIVNNRRHARALFERIADRPGACHLTTLMFAKHRSRVLDDVRKRLRDGRPCRLVSTSLIEAGVDVDFPTVLRAEAGLDAIAQAAGRCNREGRRAVDASEVLVFSVANPDWAPPPELKQFAQVFREIHRHYAHDLLGLDAVHAYFQQLYWQKGADQLDRHQLLSLLRNSRIESLPFETLSAKFRMIESVMCPVIVPFDGDNDTAKNALQSLHFAKSCGAIARTLQPYLVQLPKAGYDALRAVQAIQPVAPGRYGEQFMELVNPDLYHPSFGLRWDNPTFKASESLVW